MKVTSIEIKPTHTWEAVGADNPLRAVVKLSSKSSTVECVLSEESMHRMLEVCADEIAAQAKARIDEFHDAVTAIDTGRSQLLVDGSAGI